MDDKRKATLAELLIRAGKVDHLHRTVSGIPFEVLARLMAPAP